MNKAEVIVVNEVDEVVGYMDKMEAHKLGILHRAISVFIIDSNANWLLQQRAEHKYHSGLLWSNAACTHPMKGESNVEAANRRLFEEMGIRTSLVKIFSIQYETVLDNGLIENEFDHIYIGYSDDLPVIDPSEVAAFKYISVAEIKRELNGHSQRFTPWFHLLFEQVVKGVLVDSPIQKG